VNWGLEATKQVTLPKADRHSAPLARWRNSVGGMWMHSCPHQQETGVVRHRHGGGKIADEEQEGRIGNSSRRGGSRSKGPERKIRTDPLQTSIIRRRERGKLSGAIREGFRSNASEREGRRIVGALGSGGGQGRKWGWKVRQPRFGGVLGMWRLALNKRAKQEDEGVGIRKIRWKWTNAGRSIFFMACNCLERPWKRLARGRVGAPESNQEELGLWVLHWKLG